MFWENIRAFTSFEIASYIILTKTILFDDVYKCRNSNDYSVLGLSVEGVIKREKELIPLVLELCNRWDFMFVKFYSIVIIDL